MRTVITGGAGFLGLELARRLLAAPDTATDPAVARSVVLLDRAEPAAAPDDDRLLVAVADLVGDPTGLHDVVAGADAVVHLASVVSADAEADPDRAWAVNVDGARAVLGACAAVATGCTFLAASSVAIFSGAVAASGDDTKPRPASTYGMTKAVLELLVNEATRRSEIDGRVARLPTVVVRPGRPNLAASSFASGVFREPLQGEDCIVPVDEDVMMVLIGARTAVAGLDALLRVPAASLGPDRGVNLPGLCVSVAEMIDACRAVGRRHELALGAIAVRPDPAISAIVGSWPASWDARQARALGLPVDASMQDVVEEFVEDRLGLAGH